MTNTINNVKHELKNAKDEVVSQKDKIVKAAGDAKDKAEDMFNNSVKEIKERGQEVQENVIAYVKKNPAKAVGFAMLAGLLLAQIIQK